MAKRAQKTAKSVSKKTQSSGDSLLTLGQIRELFVLMADNDVRAVDIRNGDIRLAIRRGTEAAAQVVQAVQAAPAPIAVAAPAPAAPKADADEGLVAITSPMVGTFYAASDPESPPYVTVGTTVAKDTVVCILEAMKVFNEIQAEVDGTIEKVCLENAAVVEFGQTLFLVRPNA